MRKRAHWATEIGNGELAHQPASDFHPLMGAATRFAEVVDNACQRRNGLLGFFGSCEVPVLCGMNEFDHQLRDKTSETDQRAVGAFQQRRQ